MNSETFITGKDAPILDIIGVGIGPFNLSMAALLEGIDKCQALFFDNNDAFNWHPGLLMEDCTLQVPLMADLVTMADPTSRYSYLNYLHETGRLYNFYFYEEFLIPRIDYNLYCQWVCKQLNNLRFGKQVTAIEESPEGFKVTVQDKQTLEDSHYYAKHVVLGTGSSPTLPKPAQHLKNNKNVIHSGQYIQSKTDLQSAQSITVIGSGQSAGEIFLDLLEDQPQFGYELNWLTRSAGFLPMEYSKLGLEHFSPDYIDHFHALNESKRDSIRKGQDLWYKGLSDSCISAIYDKLYKRSVGNKSLPVTLQARSELTHVNDQGDNLTLHFKHSELEENFSFDSQRLILATGYRHNIPHCLSPLLPLLKKDSQQRLQINRNYEIASKSPLSGRLFVQNAELHSHGIAAPDLGLGAYRSAVIINAIIDKQQFKIQDSNVYQHFGIAKKWQKDNQDMTAKKETAPLCAE